MDIAEIKKCKAIAEKAIETIIAEYEIQTGTHVWGIELNEIEARSYRGRNYYRNIKLEVKL